MANVNVRKDNNTNPQQQQQGQSGSQQQGGGMMRREPQRGLFHGDPFQELRSFFGLDPMFEMASPLRRLMRFDPWSELGMGGQEGMFNPAIEIKETEQNYLLTADVPGLKESDIDVTLTGNRLVVSGQRTQETSEERETYHSRQRSYGSFSRSFMLPEGADVEHVHAELKHGVLTIVVPKSSSSQSRKIEVKSGTSGLKG